MDKTGNFGVGALDLLKISNQVSFFRKKKKKSFYDLLGFNALGVYKAKRGTNAKCNSSVEKGVQLNFLGEIGVGDSYSKSSTWQFHSSPPIEK